jgi:calcineurin-like phosphoesterase family protein
MMKFHKQQVFFSGDWHYNHLQPFIWEARGYKSVQEHNESLVREINNVVAPEDILFNLGDLCLNASIEQFEELISAVKCQTIYLLWGNHPNKHYKNIYKPMVKSILGDRFSDLNEIYPLRYKNVVYLGHYAEICVNGQMIILSHYPFSIWNEMNHSSWCLTGHSHYHFAPSTAEDSTSKILDVGWDGHKKPWSFDEIKEVMATKKVPVVDHHV